MCSSAKSKQFKFHYSGRCVSGGWRLPKQEASARGQRQAFPVAHPRPHFACASLHTWERMGTPQKDSAVVKLFSCKNGIALILPRGSLGVKTHVTGRGLLFTLLELSVHISQCI